MFSPLSSKFYVPSSAPCASRSGQALVESIVAIGALMIGLMGVLTLLSRAIGTNRLLSDGYVGTYLATEGVEVMKNDLDHNILEEQVNPATPWNANLCDAGPGGTASFELQYDTADLHSVYIGDATVNSTAHLKYDANRGYQYLSGAATPFIRTVKVNCNLDGGEGIAVSSIVSWVTRGGASFSSNIEDHFYHYR